MSRFFVNPENIGNNLIILNDADDLHHMMKVLRLKEGDEVDISDGAEWEYHARIETIGRDEAQLAILDKQAFASEPSVEVTLFQGIPKQGKMETIVQKCVELGVHRIVPVFMDRTVVVDRGNFGKKIDRWNKVSAEAVKQCRRGIIPEVTAAIRMPDLVSSLAGEPGHDAVSFDEFDLVLLPYENEKGTTINVVVSGGQANITIPSGIVGMSRADAEATLQNIGLVTSVQEQYNTEVPEGTVISIEPGEGTSVATGETVVLYVSKGEENDDVILQDLIGKSSDEAKSILETQGLNYSVQTGNDANYENGAVIAMDPGAGQTVKKGDTITITINGTGDGSSGGDGYICYSPLSQPQGYQGGTVKLELVQGDLVSVIYEGDNPWSGGAYSTPIESTSGEEGVINVYENDLLIAKYPSVTFQKK